MADKIASTSFQQVATRVLVKPCPAPGTSLLELGSNASSSGDYTNHRSNSSFHYPAVFTAKYNTAETKTRSYLFLQEDYWQMSQRTTVGSVAGCLAWNQEEWMNIGAEDQVLSVLKEDTGFLSIPTSSNIRAISFWDIFPNSEKGKALDLEVQLLKEKGAIEGIPMTLGFYSYLFVVAKAYGGYRPLLDLFASPQLHLSSRDLWLRFHRLYIVREFTCSDTQTTGSFQLSRNMFLPACAPH